MPLDDPYETENLADDPDHAEHVEELKNAILAHVPDIFVFNTTAKDHCDASEVIIDGVASGFCCSSP